MRLVPVLALSLLAPAAAFAQPAAGPPLPPAAEEPPADPPAPPPAPAPPPPSAVPPINITITNTSNSTGNTSTNTSTSSGNTTTDTTTNTNTNTDSVPVTSTTQVAEPAPTVPPAPAPMPVEQTPTGIGCGWRHTPASRWLAVGVLGTHHRGGARIAVDLLGRGHFTLGVAGSVLGEPHDDNGDDDFDRRPDEAQWRLRGSGVVYAAWSHDWGRWSLRAELGVGAGVVDDLTPRIQLARTTDPGSGSSTFDDSDHKWVHVAEVSLMVSRQFGDRWGIGIGPVLTGMVEHEHGDHADDSEKMPAHAHEAAFFVALRHRM